MLAREPPRNLTDGTKVRAPPVIEKSVRGNKRKFVFGQDNHLTESFLHVCEFWVINENDTDGNHTNLLICVHIAYPRPELSLQNYENIEKHCLEVQSIYIYIYIYIYVYIVYILFKYELFKVCLNCLVSSNNKY